MRPILLLLFLVLLTACVSSGKFRRTTAELTAATAARDSIIEVRQDSIRQLLADLNRARGGNDALQTAQERLQDRLLDLDDQLEGLRGNLSSTSSDLQQQLARMRAARQRAEAGRDSVLAVQQEIVEDFQERIDEVSSRLVDSLDGRLSPGAYFVNSRPGEAIVSLQEEVLFKSGSVTNLREEAEDLLGLMAEILEKEPLLKLTIVGHTDNQPNPRRGSSNWEYAALRATRIADEIARVYNLSPNRFIAASQGEYGPTRSNSTEEGRRFNRRIDFVFSNNVGNLTRQLSKLLPPAQNGN